jgi:hypothetical protein
MKLLDIINENEDKKRKKIRAVFKALDKKVFRKVHIRKIFYVLPDHYKVLGDNEPGLDQYKRKRRYGDDVIFVQVGHDGENNQVKFFYTTEGEDKIERYIPNNIDQYSANLSFVNDKFKPFNIRMVFKRHNGEWE